MDGGEPQPVARWRQRAAGVVATVVQLGALACVLSLLIEGAFPGLTDDLSYAFGLVGLPVQANLLNALVLAVLGTALRRRKRAALWTLLLLQFLNLLFLGFIELFVLFVPDLLESELDVSSPGDLQQALLVDIGLTVLCVVVLLVLRQAFPAKLVRGALLRALGVLVGGVIAVSLIGWGLAEVFPGTLVRTGDRLAWAANQTTLEQFPLPRFGVGSGPGWLSFLLGLLGALVLGYAMVVFFRSERSRRLLGADEELRVRELLAEHSEPDSLGYFATRRDKSVVFAPSGRAALTYRVFGGASLASGDPIGDEQEWPSAVAAWLAEAHRYGWLAGVLGASERGARAYTGAGLKALEIGDEAVLDVREFNLAGPDRRSVRQAVSRVERAGYRTTIRRHAEIPAEEMARILDLAQHWRGTETERGFSMALGRLGDPSDGRCVMVEAYDAQGRLRGLLSFVPWGRRGLSLDLMRRDRDAGNGLNEYLVAELVAASGRLGVQRISLNFAMFRAVFEEGEKIGAGPVLRAWRGALRLASRFFQLESLYRSNAKYGPDWVPRFLCYQRARNLPRVSLVAGVAEGFVPSTRSLVKRGPRRVLDDTTLDEDFVGRVRDLEERAAHVPTRQARRPEQVRVRIAKLDRLRADGVDPYPVGFDRDSLLADVRDRFAGLAAGAHTGQRVSVTGRVVASRELGGLSFVRLRDFSGELQVMLSAERLGAAGLAGWKSGVDLGDHVGVSGEVVASRRGELSVLADRWTVTAKCLHPLPDKRKGLSDPETRVRQRYLDLVVNPESARMLRTRSDLVRSVREFLHGRRYLEVETPMLQAVHGGANARPFVTHINAYDMRMYLRIAPELYLKRLCVAGVDRVFELNRNFRNEGADATHNPEFTMLEAYQAYADYTTMLHLMRELVQRAAVSVHGAQLARRPAPDGTIVEHDISGQWPVVTVHDAVSSALGEKVGPDTPDGALRGLLTSAGIAVHEEWGHGDLLLAAYDDLVEARTVGPTFYTDFPTDVSPLTRQHRVDPRLAERWDLVAFGAEIGTAYSELTDPIEQRRRLEAQSLKAASGDVEAMELDEDFLRALEHGMPPTGGLGMGVDRLLMMLTGASIRQSVLFPFVRPLN
ncbi:bifunctional lysylphosphatidylglycerol synthetase/lysine--tRNA ligase LysX [Solihabitans fulvus]|uniref:Lysine--tRNA ligase n=1 Tax=Solihabitans fulvus TaxID=1892852 RepID=A0A5B2XJ40_9PSEU|nr:bifunctional lysylphosphatidylglycerol synthetase/lysine--tRNA ligase LysX [Solihabitans fulvus]KAA2263847.1 bifunctional lysylphosphatidylglycerol synthetase/lysine--tRNA ligase LysX [Solihabitans fulvus]